MNSGSKEKCGGVMFKDIHGIKHWKEEPDPVVELGRINYKGGVARMYLPKRICNKLKLDREKDHTLIIVAHTANTLFLIKDNEVAHMLRPRILKMRSPLFANKGNNKYLLK